MKKDGKPRLAARFTWYLTFFKNVFCDRLPGARVRNAHFQADHADKALLQFSFVEFRATLSCEYAGQKASAENPDDVNETTNAVSFT